MIEVVPHSTLFPAWSDVKSFSWYDLTPDREQVFAVRQPRARVLVTAGGCQVRQGSRSQVLREGQFVPLEPGEGVLVAGGAAQAVIFEGDWGEELGGCGIFRAARCASPTRCALPAARWRSQ